MQQPIQVAAAIIEDEAGRILCALRGPGAGRAHHWELPGGKVEPGESPAQALLRELYEEFGVEAETDGQVFHRNLHRYPDCHIQLLSLRCHLAPEEARALRPLEHSAILWLEPASLLSLVWAPADLPVVHRLARLEGQETTQ